MRLIKQVVTKKVPIEGSVGSATLQPTLNITTLSFKTFSFYLAIVVTKFMYW